MLGEINALRAVIHMVWVETREGTTHMPDDVRVAVKRSLDPTTAALYAPAD